MNDIEVLKKEYLKGRVIHLAKLLEVSKGYPKAWNEYAHEQDRTVDELLKLIRNIPEPKQSIKTKLINWTINKLKKLL